jgi:hypothetical protein
MAERHCRRVRHRVPLSPTVGNYEFDGTKLVTHADGASNPAMLKDQVRHIEFESRDRMVAAPISGLVGQNAGLRLAWERVH